jgi:hypothetical protein
MVCSGEQEGRPAVFLVLVVFLDFECTAEVDSERAGSGNEGEEEEDLEKEDWEAL